MPRIVIIIGALVFCLLASTTVLADSVSFDNVVALRNGSRIDLAANPGITFEGSHFSFLVDLHGTTITDPHTLQVTFAEMGFAPVMRTYLVPSSSSLPPDYSLLFSWDAQSRSFSPTPVTLTLTLLDDLSGAITQRQVYNFNVVQPVPEPATSALLALGLGGLIARRRSRQKL